MSEPLKPPLKPLARPVIIELDDDAGFNPAGAPMLPDDDMPAPITPLPAGPAGRIFRGIAGAFILFMAVAISYDFITQLLARHPVLGMIAAGFAFVAAAVLLVLMMQELLAYFRLKQLDRLHGRAEDICKTHDLHAARALCDEMFYLYRNRPEMAQNIALFRAQSPLIFDADGLIDYGAQLLTPLDNRARAEIEMAARQVALVTAFVPIALADLAIVLFANMRMIRRIAQIYGGRSGGLASWYVLGRVFTHLLATGALSLGDDFIGSVAGGGLLSKLSRRFGEGVVNAGLTARVGLAVMEQCRPLPFGAGQRPMIPGLLTRALTGLFDKADRG